jgi:hypothetical protein
MGARATNRRKTAASLVFLRTTRNPCGSLRRFMALDRRECQVASCFHSFRVRRLGFRAAVPTTAAGIFQNSRSLLFGVQPNQYFRSTEAKRVRWP